MEKKLCSLAFLALLACALFTSVKADTITTSGTFNLYFTAGQSFNVQDTYHDALINFAVASGTLNATASLNMTDSGGTFLITPVGSGAIYVTCDESNFYALFDGEYYTAPFTFSAGVAFLITWQWTPPSVTPIVVGTGNTTFYLRSDQYTTNNVSAYGLDTTNTNSALYVSDASAGDVSVTYGFRVWLVHYGGSTTELTSGTPVAQMTRASDGSGWQNATWTPSETSLSMGYDAIKVTVYLQFGAGSWTARASYVSDVIVSSVLYEQTWRFYLYTSKTTTTSTTARFDFGSYTYESRIEAVGFKEPTAWEIANYRWLHGDYVGFILGAYLDEIGVGAYLLIVLLFCGVLYARHRSFWPVLFLFIVFGGSGGLVWAFVPVWAAAVVSAFLVVGLAYLIFKVIR